MHGNTEKNKLTQTLTKFVMLDACPTHQVWHVLSMCSQVQAAHVCYTYSAYVTTHISEHVHYNVIVQRT